MVFQQDNSAERSVLCAVSFLEGVIKEMLESKQARTEQPLLFLRMHVAQQQLLLGQLGPCKAAIESGKVTLDNLHDVGFFNSPAAWTQVT